MDGYRAVDTEPGFNRRVRAVFPNVEGPASGERSETNVLNVVDPPRFRRMRLHLVAVCELNRETWEYIRKETDDDYEWLHNPTQSDQLGLPLTDERINAWLAMMKQWEDLLKGGSNDSETPSGGRRSRIHRRQIRRLDPQPAARGHGQAGRPDQSDTQADLSPPSPCRRVGGAGTGPVASLLPGRRQALGTEDEKNPADEHDQAGNPEQGGTSHD
jgi:hypothetical protein